MDRAHSINGGGSPVVLEVNISHQYKIDEVGALEFRIRNQGPRLIRALDLSIDSPREKSKRLTALKKTSPSSEERASVQFEPCCAGEAPLQIEISFEDEDSLPLVYRARMNLTVPSVDEGLTSSTSFDINIHDVEKFAGNDLSGMVTIAGNEKEINEDRVREKMKRNEPFWMAVDLKLDEDETARKRKAFRQLFVVPAGQAPQRTRRAILESLDSSPVRIFVHSTPELRFGRHTQKNDVVLRFLPDFQHDERSKSISAEQFVAQCQPGKCVMSLARECHAPTSFNGNVVRQGEEVPLSSGSEIKIGSYEFTLKVSGAERLEDPLWTRTLQEIRRSDPGDDPFESCYWDMLLFSRTINGPEERYLWLFRKMEIGWSTDGATTLILDRSITSEARLSFWNGRYYLEALDPGQRLVAGGRTLEPGDIAGLGSETEISCGPLRFQWRLL